VTLSFLHNISFGVDNDCEILNVPRLQYTKLVVIYDTRNDGGIILEWITKKKSFGRE
jgi:hypothetical protein